MTNASREPTELGEVLLRRLGELSMSQAELARRTRLAKNTIQNAIYGRHEPHRKTIEILTGALDLPVEVLARAGKAAATAAESFGRWLLHRGNPALWITAGGSLLIGGLLFTELPAESPSPGVWWVQFAVILLLLTLLLRHRDRMTPDVQERASGGLRAASTAARDFRRSWIGLWLSWLTLYLSLALASGFDLAPGCEEALGVERWVGLWLNTVQNGGTLCLFLCYQVLAQRTVEDDLSRRSPPWMPLGLALLLPFLGELAALQLAPTYTTWFGWLSGFGQGTALALLVGRLDSKYVEAPPGLIALLYFYAAIQGAWPVLSCELGLLLVFFALVLKGLLFLLVAWLFESDILLFYLTRMRMLDSEVRRDRSYFLRLYREGAVEKL